MIYKNDNDMISVKFLKPERGVIRMDNKELALKLHKQWNGKLETVSKTPVKTREDLALAYTPGVAEPCKQIPACPIPRMYG